MSVVESIGLLQAKDADGNSYILYPVTKLEALEEGETVLTQGDVVDTEGSTAKNLPISARLYTAFKNLFNDMLAKGNTSVSVRSTNASTSARCKLTGSQDSNGNPLIGYYSYPANNTTQTDQMCVYFDGSDFYAQGKKDGGSVVKKKLGEPTFSVKRIYGTYASNKNTFNTGITGKTLWKSLFVVPMVIDASGTAGNNFDNGGSITYDSSTGQVIINASYSRVGADFYYY